MLLHSKKAYFVLLRLSLIWKCSPAEYALAINQYEAFFRQGLLEGKTEAQLCQEAGRIRDAVRTVSPVKTQSSGVISFRPLTLLRVILTVVLLYLPEPLSNQNSCSWFPIWIAAPILFPLLFWLIWRGYLPKPGYTTKSKQWLYHVLTSLLFFLPYLLYFYLIFAYQPTINLPYPSFLDTPFIGLYLYNFYKALAFCNYLLGVYVLWKTFEVSLQYLSNYSHMIGAIFSFILLYATQPDDFDERIILHMLIPLLPYLTGLLTTFFIYFIYKKRRS